MKRRDLYLVSFLHCDPNRKHGMINNARGLGLTYPVGCDSPGLTSSFCVSLERCGLVPRKVPTDGLSTAPPARSESSEVCQRQLVECSEVIFCCYDSYVFGQRTALAMSHQSGERSSELTMNPGFSVTWISGQAQRMS